MIVNDSFLHVAVAVIIDEQQRVLLSRRHEHVHQGGLWEFPGGKIDSNESVQQALRRELNEELGIQIDLHRPLMRIPHHYPGKPVLLDVWLVSIADGVPYGRERQPIEWVDIKALRRRSFPAANHPIIHALELPAEYLITPEPTNGAEPFLQKLQTSLTNGVRLLQLRVGSLLADEYRTLATAAINMAHDNDAKILLNADPELVATLGADGVHLNSKRLGAAVERPLSKDYLVAASCHTPDELAKAVDIEADFALLSPVQKTASHPLADPIGWTTFSRWVDAVPVPVYALGGLSSDDLNSAFERGAQGIAAIRGLWGGKRPL